ncbi:hypothetical protein DND90_31455 [Pseudomonas syringae pv. maculicola]|nr:hypothetical protein DND90_31455 [Pseudomonas syringae pv. maculicola]
MEIATPLASSLTSCWGSCRSGVSAGFAASGLADDAGLVAAVGVTAWCSVKPSARWPALQTLLLQWNPQPVAHAAPATVQRLVALGLAFWNAQGDRHSSTNAMRSGSGRCPAEWPAPG